MNKSQRDKKLEKDYEELKKLAIKSSKDFGQDSIMISYDKIQDVSFMGDNWSKKIPKNLTGKKKILIML